MENNDFNYSWDQLSDLAEPSFTKWYAPIMYYLCLAGEIKVSVEIGIYQGYTTIALAEAMKNNNGKLIAIENNKSYIKLVKEKLTKKDLIEYVEIINCNSMEYTLDRQVSLIFVDGDKTYEGMKADIKRYSPYVVKNGFMFVHDYRVEECRKAIEDGFNWNCWERVLLLKRYGLCIARRF